MRIHLLKYCFQQHNKWWNVILTIVFLTIDVKLRNYLISVNTLNEFVDEQNRWRKIIIVKRKIKNVFCDFITRTISMIFINCFTLQKYNCSRIYRFLLMKVSVEICNTILVGFCWIQNFSKNYLLQTFWNEQGHNVIFF